MKDTLLAVAIVIATAASACAQEAFSKDSAARIDVIPFETRTLSDHDFRAGDKTAGTATTVAGVLRLPLGFGRVPVVVLLEGSAGIVDNNDVWDRQFLSHGIATFTIDGFSGRGIANLIADQSKLGLLNMIVDLYRGLGVLAKHPRIDPGRIAVMGFSRGGIVALYSSMRRFQSAWNDSGITPAAYVPLYPFCNIEFVDDTDVVGGPIRIFHGSADDYVSIKPCEAYVQRLKNAGKDAQITTLPNAYHAFDLPSLPSQPFMLPGAQETDCIIVEDRVGSMINKATGSPYSSADACNGLGAHIGYSAEATRVTDAAVLDLLSSVFKTK
ncbi:MAG: dienelactone hydrolase family protein [Xanthobacteraceae bacterium]